MALFVNMKVRLSSGEEGTTLRHANLSKQSIHIIVQVSLVELSERRENSR